MKAHLTQLLATAAKTIAPDSADLSILLERPKSAEHGDFATNLALVLAKPLKQNPRAIASQLIAALPSSDFSPDEAGMPWTGYVSEDLHFDTNGSGAFSDKEARK